MEKTIRDISEVSYDSLEELYSALPEQIRRYLSDECLSPEIVFSMAEEAGLTDLACSDEEFYNRFAEEDEFTDSEHQRFLKDIGLFNSTNCLMERYLALAKALTI